MFLKEIGINETQLKKNDPDEQNERNYELMIEFIDREYLTKHSRDFREVIVSPGEALLVMEESKDVGFYTSSARFKVEEIVEVVEEPKEEKKSFIQKILSIFKRKKKEEEPATPAIVNTDTDLTQNKVDFILADIRGNKYRVPFTCRTSDFCIVKGIAKVDAHINKENLRDLTCFNKREAVNDGLFQDYDGKVKIITIADIENQMAEETKSKVGGLLLSLSSDDLIVGSYRDVVRKAIDQLKLEWTKKGFVVENIDVDFEDTTYETSKMKVKELEDTEIGDSAEYDSKIKKIERDGHLDQMKKKNELELKLMEAEGMRKIITANPETLGEEIAKDNAHRRHIELMHAEAELEKAKKGYLEGYIDGYKDGQDYILSSNIVVEKTNFKKNEEDKEKSEGSE